MSREVEQSSVGNLGLNLKSNCVHAHWYTKPLNTYTISLSLALFLSYIAIFKILNAIGFCFDRDFGVVFFHFVNFVSSLFRTLLQNNKPTTTSTPVARQPSQYVPRPSEKRRQQS